MSLEKEVPLGRGGAGEVTRIGDKVVKKLHPLHIPEGLYKLLFLTRRHPYSPDNPANDLVVKALEYKRDIAHHLSHVASDKVEVVKARAIKGGLEMNFVDGRPVTDKDRWALEAIDRTVLFLERFGAPTWSLRGPYGLKNWLPLKAKMVLPHGFDNALITSDGKVQCVDYEEGLPHIVRGQFSLGDIDHALLRKGLNEFREQIKQRIREEGCDRLEKSEKIEEFYWNAFRYLEGSLTVKIQRVLQALNPEYMEETVEWLLKEGRLSDQEASELRVEIESISETKNSKVNIKPHLLIHLFLGLIFPTPLSSVSRFTYTVGARTLEKIRRKDHKIHTGLVAFTSLVPSLGNFAYIIDLIPTENPRLTRLALQSIAHHAFFTSLENLLYIWGKRSVSRKAVALGKKVYAKAPLIQNAVRKAANNQFGEETVQYVADHFIRAAESEHDPFDDFPTQVLINDQAYFIHWRGNRVFRDDPSTERLIPVGKEEANLIQTLLTNELIAACQDYEKIMNHTFE